MGKSVPVCSGCLGKGAGGFNVTEVSSGPGFYSVKQTFTGGPQFKNFYDGKKVAQSIVCTNCGHDLVAFESSGKMGCSECYNVFNEQVKRIIRNRK